MAIRRLASRPVARASASASAQLVTRPATARSIWRLIPPGPGAAANKQVNGPAITTPRCHHNLFHNRWSSTASTSAPDTGTATGTATGSKIWSFEEMQDLTSRRPLGSGDRNRNRDVTVIDTREAAELESTGRIPGAINIPISSAPDSFHITADEFEDRFGFDRPAPDRELVFYCKAGVRSRAAAAIARDAGWEKVGEYPGSWLDWSGRGGAVER